MRCVQESCSLIVKQEVLRLYSYFNCRTSLYTIVRHHYIPRSYVVQTEDGRNYRQSAPTGLPRPGARNKSSTAIGEQSRPGSSHDQVAAPAVLPDLPTQEQYPQPPKESSGTPYARRSGRRVVKANLQAWPLNQFMDYERLLSILFVFASFYFFYFKEGCDI